MWAIMGGSGFEKFHDFTIVEEIDVETPFGSPSAKIAQVKIAGHDALFLSRHGKHHELSPSHINFRANIFALKMLGATKLLSISAVGSLRKELKPGDCVVPSQYFDRTKSLRDNTFCVKGLVGHVSLAKPVDENLVTMAKEIFKADGFQIHYDKTYVCIEGPHFSTKAESNHYRQLGADIIGMTNFPEYALAREAGMVYFPLSFVTDYDCWDDSIEHVTIEKIIELMKENNKKAFHLMTNLIQNTHDIYPKGCIEQSLKHSLLTPMETLHEDVQTWFKILCK